MISNMWRPRDAYEEYPPLRDLLKTKPYPFQMKGIEFLEKREGRALLADDMGLGKSIQVMGYLALHPELRPCLIVCPANAKWTWANLLSTHSHMSYDVLSGQTPHVVRNDVWIINYDILPYWTPSLLEAGVKIIIIDECQYIKNRGIKRTKAVQSICKGTKCKVVALSGTPILNRPAEFWPVLNLIEPKQFSSFWNFAFQFCAPKKGWGGQWMFNGATNTQQLHHMLKKIVLRRMKEEVLKDLPRKTRSVIPITIHNRREYKEAETDFLRWYEEKRGSERAEAAAKAQALVKLGQLRHLSAVGKLPDAVSFIDDVITSQKIVVFCHHKDIFEEVAKRYQEVACVGGKAGKKRQDEIDHFQRDPKKRVFVASLSADAAAITLTAASTVLFIEQEWTPGQNDQAEDRVLRIGQKEHVNIYYMVGKNTVDETVWEAVETKRRIIKEVMDGKSSSGVDLEVLYRAMRKRQGDK